MAFLSWVIFSERDTFGCLFLCTDKCSSLGVFQAKCQPIHTHRLNSAGLGSDNEAQT